MRLRSAGKSKWFLKMGNRLMIQPAKRFFHECEEVFIFFIGVIAIEPIPDLFGIEILVRSKQPVPNGQYRTIIAIGVRLLPVMVDFVHVRRNENIAQGKIYPPG